MLDMAAGRGDAQAGRCKREAKKEAGGGREMKYYYWTNGDHTTHNGFLPFGPKGRGRIARAPDWNPDASIECGQGLHVVKQWPLATFQFVSRENGICYEVKPVGAALERGGKVRCSALKKTKKLTWAEALRHSRGMKIEGWLDLRGCSALTSLTIPEGMSIGGGLDLRRCSALTSLTIPEGMSIGGWLDLRGCSALTSLTIPEGMSIGGGLYLSGCDKLRRETIPTWLISKGIFD